MIGTESGRASPPSSAPSERGRTLSAGGKARQEPGSSGASPALAGAAEEAPAREMPCAGLAAGRDVVLRQPEPFLSRAACRRREAARDRLADEAGHWRGSVRDRRGPAVADGGRAARHR